MLAGYRLKTTCCTLSYEGSNVDTSRWVSLGGDLGTLELQLRLLPLPLQLLPVVVEPPQTHDATLEAVPVADGNVSSVSHVTPTSSGSQLTCGSCPPSSAAPSGPSWSGGPACERPQGTP